MTISNRADSARLQYARTGLQTGDLTEVDAVATTAIIDLRDGDIRDVDLRDVDLRGVDLRGVDLQGVDLREVSDDNAVPDVIDNVAYLPSHDGGLLGAATKGELVIKRAIDLTLTTIVLTILSPLLLITAAVIKLSSPGPILHRQIRIGQNGHPFTFLKFRSMYIDAETRKAELETHNEANGPIFKIKADPRITPIGRIIRKLSIDETPQLLHVLSGRMTLVGPRPHLPEEVAAYQGQAHRRLAVKPGITGIWQVSGRSDLDFDTWIKLDIQYLDTWNLTLDAKLLARTLTAVATGRGAY